MDATRHAWTVRHYGGPEVLSPVTQALTTPAAGEVLIRIRASAVSRADSLMRAGQPKFARLFLGLNRPKAGLSGTCFAGVIVALGEGVSAFRIGDAVFGEAGLRFGANATHICLDATGSLVRKPDLLPFEEAATLFDGALTSWHFLTRVAPVRPADRVLILGGAGSLGSAAVQFAKALGATVTASASQRNRALLQSLGADHVVDYQTDDPLGSGAPHDVIFDTLGVTSFRAAKPALASGGRYLCPVLSLSLVRDMGLSRLHGDKTATFAAAGLLPPTEHRAQMAEILDLIARDRFSPLMDRSYPLADLVEAHRYVETGRKRGNVVVI